MKRVILTISIDEDRMHRLMVQNWWTRWNCSGTRKHNFRPPKYWTQFHRGVKFLASSFPTLWNEEILLNFPHDLTMNHSRVWMLSRTFSSSKKVIKTRFDEFYAKNSYIHPMKRKYSLRSKNFSTMLSHLLTVSSNLSEIMGCWSIFISSTFFWEVVKMGNFSLP